MSTDYLNDARRKMAELKKKDLEKARYIAAKIIPSIREDIGDDSLQIDVEEIETGATTPKKGVMSLNYTVFLDGFSSQSDYDRILALVQHEVTHWYKEFPETAMHEVMIDVDAAKRFGPYALYSFHCNAVLVSDFTSAWLYHLGSLVNLKPYLLDKSQRDFVEAAVKTYYPKMFKDMLGIIGHNIPTDERKKWVSRKLGNLEITEGLQQELDNMFHEMARGISMDRKNIKRKVKNPFSSIRQHPQAFVKDYEKLENALVIK